MSNINSKISGAVGDYRRDQIENKASKVKSKIFPPVLHHNINLVFPTPPGYTPKGSPSSSTLRSSLAFNSNNVIPDIRSVNILRHPSREFISASEQKLYNIEEYREYRRMANEANAKRKIFLVFGNYRTVKNGLLRRGWIEKVPLRSYKALRQLSHHALLMKAKKGNDYEKVLLSKMVEHCPAYFIWQMRGNADDYMNAFPHRNRIRRGREFDFSTKLGFIGCAESVHWCTQTDKSELKCPRFHRLNLEEQSKFLEDFRITECFSLLSYINDRSDDELNPLHAFDGIVASSIINFAIDRVAEFVKYRIHPQIDGAMDERTDEQWDNFMTSSRLVITRNEKFRCDEVEFSNYRKQVEKALEEAKPYWPTLQMDGYNNLWIMKPGCSCRGRGIVIMKNYENIINHANKYAKARYMVQKYIERPLLIYKTKFDIRQYMLLTFNENVNIWMYKDCYLRFSSQEFTLDSFWNSIHLTNNSIQKHCKNGKRSTNLPAHNMWSLSDFRSYLNNSGFGNVWPSIYEGMKKSVIAIVQASLVDTNIIQNAFEIYGCDFMLNENFEPYLLEVNSSPDLSPSTVVTRRICPMALEDLLKVIVDFPRNSKASTGNFERIFSIPLTKVSSYIPGLMVNGTSMKIHQEESAKKPKAKRKSSTKVKTSKKKTRSQSTQVVLYNPEKSSEALEKSTEKLTELVNDLIPGETQEELKPKDFLNSKIKEALALHFSNKSGKGSIHKNDNIVNEFVNVLQRKAQKAK